jgi:hypothetical protein
MGALSVFLFLAVLGVFACVVLILGKMNELKDILEVIQRQLSSSREK